MMAPTDWVSYVKTSYFGLTEKPRPVISTESAALLSVTFTILYVLPFYLSRTTRPSPNLNRDAPSVIQARIRTVTLACIIASLSVAYLLIVPGKATPASAAHALGWWPIDLSDLLKTLGLTCILFLGPLFELLVVERQLIPILRGRLILSTLSSWQGYRNYVAGPITEEVLFRSVFVPLHMLAQVLPNKIVLLTPLYFGIAHIHHFYEFKLTHPRTPILPAVLRSLFQFTYTTLFGWYAAFIYMRTGSLYACIIIHAFCNAMGLPRLWGRVQPYSTTDLDDETPKKGSILQSIIYYALLILGAYLFYKQLWILTESTHALGKFDTEKSK